MYNIPYGQEIRHPESCKVGHTGFAPYAHLQDGGGEGAILIQFKIQKYGNRQMAIWQVPNCLGVREIFHKCVLSFQKNNVPDYCFVLTRHGLSAPAERE